MLKNHCVDTSQHTYFSVLIQLPPNNKIPNLPFLAYNSLSRLDSKQQRNIK